MGVVGSQDAQGLGQGLLVQWDSLLEPARSLVSESEVAPRDKGVGVVGPQDAFAVGQVLFVQVDGLFEFARGQVGESEVAPRDESVGVVGPQNTQDLGQVPLVQVDGLFEFARRLIGAGEVVARGQGARVVGSQGLGEEVHGVGQGQGGLWVPEFRRVLQGVGEGGCGAGVGEQALRVVLPGRLAQLLHQIEGLATTTGTVRNRDGGDVHRLQEPGDLLLDPPPALGLVLPRLPDHAALKPVDHHPGAVLREPADRGVNELAQRPTGVTGSPVQCLQPASRDARGREHGENPELNAGDRPPVGAPLLDPLERALEGQPQGDAHDLGILIPRLTLDAGLQRGPLEHVEVGRQSVPVAPRCRRGLRDRDRKIAQGPGDGIRRLDVRRLAVGLVGAVEQNADRLLALEDPDGDVRPAVVLPVRPPRRRHQNPHTLPAGNETGQVIGVLDVVEDDQTIRLLRRGQRGQAALRDHLAGGTVLGPHAELQPQLGNPGEDRLARTRGHPGHQLPVLLLAAGRHGGGQLRLPTAAHAREHGTRRSPGDDRLEQPRLLPPFDEPDRLHGTTAQPNARGASQHGSGYSVFEPVETTVEMSGLLLLPDLDHLELAPNRIDTVEQLPEGPDPEVRRSRRQAHELPSDGPHERVEEGLGLRLHLPMVFLNPPADDIPETVGIPHGGHDDGVVPHQFTQENLDLGHRAPQQVGVDAPLLALAPNTRDLGLQARGDPLAERVDRPPSPFESGDVAPARARLPDHRSHTAGRRIHDRIRGLQQEHGQTDTEPSQGERTDHTGSLQDRPVGERGTAAPRRSAPARPVQASAPGRRTRPE